MTDAGIIGFIMAHALISLLVASASYIWLSLATSAIFRKLGIPSWKGWVPIIREIEMLKLGSFSPWLILLNLIPGLGSFVVYIMTVISVSRISTRLGHGQGIPVLYVFFPLIALSVLAWAGSSQLAPVPGNNASFMPPAANFGSTLTERVGGADRIGDAERFGAERLGEGGRSFSPYPAHTPFSTPVPTPRTPVAPVSAWAPPPAAASGEPSPVVQSPVIPTTVLPTPVMPAPFAPEPQFVPFDDETILSVNAFPETPQVQVQPEVPQPSAVAIVEQVVASAAPAVAFAEPAESTVHINYAPPLNYGPAPSPAPVLPEVEPDVVVEPAAEIDEHTVFARRRLTNRWYLTAGNQRYELTGNQVLIGRQTVTDPMYPDAQVIAPPDEGRTISKRHAFLRRDGETWHVTDLDSTNGVTLITDDGEEQNLTPNQEHPLTPNFYLGDVKLTLESDSKLS